MDVNLVNGEEFFKVKWKNYPYSQCTWEPRSHLTHCESKLKRFEGFFEGVSKVIGESDQGNIEFRRALDSNIIRKFAETPYKKERKNKSSKKKTPSKSKIKKASIFSNEKQKSKKKTHLDISSNISTELNSSENFGETCPVKTLPNLKLELPEDGCLDYDTPARVIDVRFKENGGHQINCVVEWNTRSDGFKPKNSKVSTSDFKIKYGWLLVDFYESRITFKQD